MQTARTIQTGDDFDALESAVRETARGRSFLDEYARRLRSTEMDKVLAAIDRLAETQQERMASSALDVLRRELDTMAASIAQTRREIAAIKPEGTGADRISSATEELDFVVRSTERATADILSAAERIQAMSGEFKAKGAEDALCDELENQATNLMIACSFQDLTGQRMNKVVNTLRYLEQRVGAMIQIWGITSEEAAAAASHDPIDKRPDAHLLNGPQREGEGVNQDDIDRMLNAPAEEAPQATSSQNDIDKLFG